MRINFIVNPVAGGWHPKDTRLGGTEESVIRWSEELVKRGHEVNVFMNHREPRTVRFLFQGVYYVERNLFNEKCDVVINVKSPDIQPRYKPAAYLTNETNAYAHDLSKFKGVIWPSEWAEENIPVNNPVRYVLPHGYDHTKIKYMMKRPKQCLYASSPDRGLETLEQIWPAIVEQHPDAHLFVTYGGRIDVPNVTCGEFTEEEMNHLYNTSEFWLHPANGGELYCISGIKAQAARAIPVYFPVMALQETVKAGIPCTDARDMYDKLVKILGDEDAKADERRKFQYLKYPNWQDSTTRLLEIIESALE